MPVRTRRALVECVVVSVQLQDGCSVFYPCCKHCFSRIDVRHDEERCICSRCGSSCARQQVDYRYRLSMTVSRERRVFGMTVFGGCLDALFGVHATGLQRLVEDSDNWVESPVRSSLLVKAVEDCFIGRHFIFGIKVTDAENAPLFGGSTTTTTLCDGSSARETLQLFGGPPTTTTLCDGSSARETLQLFGGPPTTTTTLCDGSSARETLQLFGGPPTTTTLCDGSSARETLQLFGGPPTTTTTLCDGSSARETLQFVANQILVPIATGGQGAAHTVVTYYRALLSRSRASAARPLGSRTTGPFGVASGPSALLPLPRRRSPSTSFNDTTLLPFNDITLLPASGLLSRRRSLNPTPPWLQSPGLVTSSAEQEEGCSTQGCSTQGCSTQGCSAGEQRPPEGCSTQGCSTQGCSAGELRPPCYNQTHCSSNNSPRALHAAACSQACSQACSRPGLGAKRQDADPARASSPSSPSLYQSSSSHRASSASSSSTRGVDENTPVPRTWLSPSRPTTGGTVPLGLGTRDGSDGEQQADFASLSDSGAWEDIFSESLGLFLCQEDEGDVVGDGMLVSGRRGVAAHGDPSPRHSHARLSVRQGNTRSTAGTVRPLAEISDPVDGRSRGVDLVTNPSPPTTPCGNLSGNKNECPKEGEESPKERESPSASFCGDEEESPRAGERGDQDGAYDCSADLFNSLFNTPTPTTQRDTPTPTTQRDTPTPTTQRDTPTPTKQRDTPTPTTQRDTPTPTTQRDTDSHARGAQLLQPTSLYARINRDKTATLDEDSLQMQGREKTSPDMVHCDPQGHNKTSPDMGHCDRPFIADSQGQNHAMDQDYDHLQCLDFVPPSQSTPLVVRAGRSGSFVPRRGNRVSGSLNFQPDRPHPYGPHACRTPLRTTTTTLRRLRAHLLHQTNSLPSDSAVEPTRKHYSLPSGGELRKRSRKSKHFFKSSFWRLDQRSNKHSGVTTAQKGPAGKTGQNLACDASVCDEDAAHDGGLRDDAYALRGRRTHKRVYSIDTMTTTTSETKPVHNVVCNKTGGRENAAVNLDGSVGHLADEESEAYDLSRDLFADSF